MHRFIKSILLTGMSTFLYCCNAFAQEDYILKINDSNYPIALDKPYTIQINGKPVTFSMAMKDTLVFKSKIFSFSYPKGFKVSTTKLDAGITQVSIITADGNGFFIQEYDNFNPTSINDLLIREFTKESINYGYKEQRSTYNRTLASGENLAVDKSMLTYQEEQNQYEVASIGKKDSGIVVATIQVTNDVSPEGRKIIDLMWKTLKLHWPETE